jgi:MoaA/NifB/PqqE/SkfB family radical SAM enzyme
MATFKLTVNSNGQVDLPEELIEQLGIHSGDQLQIEKDGLQLKLLPPLTSLFQVYIEPTNTCNLNCSTCMRNIWDEKPGMMSHETFELVISGLQEFSPIPRGFFGGYGEPLHHPQILDMVAQVKALGATVEMITNGTLLTRQTAEALVELGLDRLWVSLDGATPESYQDVRLGDELPHILDNLKYLRLLTLEKYGWSPWMSRPALGIAFVALGRNIADLPKVLQLGESLGARYFSISNLLAHSTQARADVLYTQSMYQTETSSQINFPRIDATGKTKEAILNLMQNSHQAVTSAGLSERTSNKCPFIEKGSLSVRWDGAVSPCLPLLHTHETYLDDRLRRSLAFTAGDLSQKSLREIWLEPDYIALRQRLRDFDFAPCTLCNSCDMADANQEDCFGNEHPTCGGCLWAQGFIQCP